MSSKTLAEKIKTHSIQCLSGFLQVIPDPPAQGRGLGQLTISIIIFWDSVLTERGRGFEHKGSTQWPIRSQLGLGHVLFHSFKKHLQTVLFVSLYSRGGKCNGANESLPSWILLSNIEGNMEIDNPISHNKAGTKLEICTKFIVIQMGDSTE